jgi:hypothetical protein
MDNFKGPDGTLVTSNSFSNIGDYPTGTQFSKAELLPAETKNGLLSQSSKVAPARI